MNKIILIALVCASYTCYAQPMTEKIPILYGTVALQQLRSAPYDQWYLPNYDGYQPDRPTIESLKKLDMRDVSIQVFFGSWCGDSKREVPRFLKVLDELGFSQKNTTIIGLGGSDSLYKQGPDGEESGKAIFRVPVFVILKKGLELNRINEFPVLSLEKDLYTILSNKPYSPNYKTFVPVSNWLNNGTLADKNASSRGMAAQLRPFVANEQELNNLGYLLIKQGYAREALKIFQINASLFPESANVISSLGEAYLRNGEIALAVQQLEKSLEINKDPQLVKPILKLLYEAKGVKG